MVHACFYSIALINDFVGSNEPDDKNPPLIKRVTDYIFAAFAFPVGAQVAFTFWSLYAIDRELVFPKIIDSFYPWWLNHALHTNVLLFILIESFLLHHQYLGWRKEASVLVGAIIAYIGWVNIVKLVTGFWVYPVLNELNNLARIAFYIGNVAFPLIFYFLGKYSHERHWHRKLVQSVQKDNEL
jgi:FAR-17a/AIG1-like protein